MPNREHWVGTKNKPGWVCSIRIRYCGSQQSLTHAAGTLSARGGLPVFSLRSPSNRMLYDITIALINSAVA